MPQSSHHPAQGSRPPQLPYRNSLSPGAAANLTDILMQALGPVLQLVGGGYCGLSHLGSTIRKGRDSVKMIIIRLLFVWDWEKAV